MASRTWWTWVWVKSGSWWWTGRPGVLWFMGSQRVEQDWVTELNWTKSLGRCCKVFLWSSLRYHTESPVFHSVVQKWVTWPDQSYWNWLPEGINAWMVYSFVVPALLLLLIHSVVSKSLRPLDCSMPGFSVFHCLPEFAQSHFHWVGDAIQPSHPPLSASPLAFNLSLHQGSFPISWLFASGRQSIVASVSASILLVNI